MRNNHRELSDLCYKQLQGIKDTQDLLSGKWKTIIVAALYYAGKMRFMDLLRHIGDIAPKVLSKELKDLEMNQLLKRTVLNTQPITVEYELLPLGESLHSILEVMGEWGVNYRNTIIDRKQMVLNA